MHEHNGARAEMPHDPGRDRFGLAAEAIAAADAPADARQLALGEGGGEEATAMDLTRGDSGEIPDFLFSRFFFKRGPEERGGGRKMR